jgi:hypothetical protein
MFGLAGDILAPVIDLPPPPTPDSDEKEYLPSQSQAESDEGSSGEKEDYPAGKIPDVTRDLALEAKAAKAKEEGGREAANKVMEEEIECAESMTKFTNYALFVKKTFEAAEDWFYTLTGGGVAKLYSLDLVRDNRNLRVGCKDERVKMDFSEMVNKVVEMSEKEFDNSLEGRLKFWWKSTMVMNTFIADVKSDYWVRDIHPQDGDYYLAKKSLTDLTTIFNAHKVKMPDLELIDKWRTQANAKEDDLPVANRDPKTKVPRIPYITVNKFVNLFEMWKTHPKHKVYARIVYNPTPADMEGAAASNELNSWAGMYLIPEQVYQLTNWDNILPWLAHIRQVTKAL